MICEACHEREATIHNRDSKSRAFTHLCDLCFELSKNRPIAGPKGLQFPPSSERDPKFLPPLPE